MPLPNDSMFSQQWHLVNRSAGLLDLNVLRVWNPTEGPAYTGQGIRTVVIDDGFDYRHSDLAPNYLRGLDFDYDGGNDFDPFGVAANAHGTAVAGIIGAAANGSGTVGIAFNTELVGYRVESYITNAWLGSIAEAIDDAANAVGGDVINISQGIGNDLTSEFGRGYSAARFDQIETAIGDATSDGRGGLGSIIVKSAGNSRGSGVGATDDYDVNCDDWGNDTRQVVVAAVDQDGYVSSYSSYGAAVLVSGFGTPGEVVTTDRVGSAGYSMGNFTNSFNGTSSAAPMVSGVVALMLDANANLGWRDVQSILANSARHVGSAVGGATGGSEFFGWEFNAASTWNGGGLHFSNDYGYGLVDALAAVRLAETWRYGNSPAQVTGNESVTTMDMQNGTVTIPDGRDTGRIFQATSTDNDIIERVTVTITFSTTWMSDVDIYLMSPDGTLSILLQDQASNLSFSGTWTFESQAYRGERGAGTWAVMIVDDATGDTLTVSDVVVRTYGADTRNDRYVFTNEYSNYDGVQGHTRAINDSNGGIDTVNAAAVTSGSNIRLDGLAGRIDGVTTTIRNIENAIGGDGRDTIRGNGDANMLYGERAGDFLYGVNGNDSLFGGVGADRLDGGNGNDQLDGGSGNDNQLGGGGNDRMAGGEGNDILSGGGGNDNLNGSIGNDRLIGGAGKDVMTGGAGSDAFVFNAAPAASNIDRITDFSTAADTIYLENSIFRALAATGELAAQAFGMGANATTAAQRIIYNGATGELFYDADGSGGGGKIQIAQLSAGLNLSADDFFII